MIYKATADSNIEKPAGSNIEKLAKICWNYSKGNPVYFYASYFVLANFELKLLISSVKGPTFKDLCETDKQILDYLEMTKELSSDTIRVGLIALLHMINPDFPKTV